MVSLVPCQNYWVTPSYTESNRSRQKKNIYYLFILKNRFEHLKFHNRSNVI
jgi:hypothetical protein